jgi:hypothetical protein
MRITFLRVVFAAAVLFNTATLAAHHPIASVYRVDEQTTIEGVVVALVYRTPHSYLQVSAPDRTKNVRLWAVECGDQRQLRRTVSEGALKPGDRVIVTGHAARDDGEWRLRLRTIVRPRDAWRWSEADR